MDDIAIILVYCLEWFNGINGSTQNIADYESERKLGRLEGTYIIVGDGVQHEPQLVR